MPNIIVAFSKIQEAKNVRNVLVRSGFSVAAFCSTAAQCIRYAEDLEYGVVVCGYRLPDMTAPRMKEELPAGFDMLAAVSPSYHEEERDGIVFVALPLKVHDLVGTLDMVCRAQERRRRKRKEVPRVRSGQDLDRIAEAKKILMERNGMTEAEAHRYIQKCSMDSGTDMAETAQMIISLLF